MSDFDDIVPRFKKGGYDPDGLRRRREWIEQRTGGGLTHVGNLSGSSYAMRGNIENPIGAAQVPLGIAGPLLVRGVQAQGVFYLPMATTEGALVRSYERGMMTLTRAGGVEVRVIADANSVCPSFFLSDLAEAARFIDWVDDNLQDIRAAAEATTRRGRLQHIRCRAYGRQVIAEFAYSTADAQGMNMIVKATDAAARWILETFPSEVEFQIFSGMSAEKRAASLLLSRGKGKWVTAAAHIPERQLRTHLGCSGRKMQHVWQSTLVGHLAAGAAGYNGQLANGLAAIFIATGQDVANVANSAVGITDFRWEDDGFWASLTLPALEIGTVGGGTALATQRECLEMLDCFGEGKANRLAEIVAAALLGGEISMAAAIANGELSEAHNRYGRNPPPEGSP